MRLTAHRSRTPVSELAANSERPWSRRRLKTAPKVRVQPRSLLPLLLLPPPSRTQQASAAPLVALQRRIRRSSWSTSASTNPGAWTAAPCSACSVAPASPPPPRCRATASLPTKWGTHPRTASRRAAPHPLPTSGTTMERTRRRARLRRLPPPRKWPRRERPWPARCAASTSTRPQISARISGLTVWPLSAHGTLGNSPEMPKKREYVTW